MGHPKFKTCHMTQPRPFQGRFVVRWLGLATINLYTKYEVFIFTHYEDMKGGDKTHTHTHTDTRRRHIPRLARRRAVKTVILDTFFSANLLALY